jgi:hypothetical protein
MSLVHHVCKEAGGLESLFLISKSNCAFANFKDEAACVAAQQKIHDSKFQAVRLVSRLRKNTGEGSPGVSAPTGPSASASSQSTQTDPAKQQQEEATPTESPVAVIADSNLPAAASAENTPQKDRFFILKSLTEEDLELSIRTCIWATQSHNEKALNEAFKVSPDNKSLRTSPYPHQSIHMCNRRITDNHIGLRPRTMSISCSQQTSLVNILVTQR